MRGKLRVVGVVHEQAVRADLAQVLLKLVGLVMSTPARSTGLRDRNTSPDGLAEPLDLVSAYVMSLAPRCPWPTPRDPRPRPRTEFRAYRMDGRYGPPDRAICTPADGPGCRVPQVGASGF